jgi:hypothetical protein
LFPHALFDRFISWLFLTSRIFLLPRRRKEMGRKRAKDRDGEKKEKPHSNYDKLWLFEAISHKEMYFQCA